MNEILKRDLQSNLNTYNQLLNVYSSYKGDYTKEIEYYKEKIRDTERELNNL